MSPLITESVPQMETLSLCRSCRRRWRFLHLFFFFFFSPPSPLRLPVGPLPPSIASKKEDVGLFLGSRSSEWGLRRRGATFMSASLSPNNHTMMDYLHTGIHVKGPSNGENGGEGGERPACFMSAGGLIALKRYDAAFSAFFTLVRRFQRDHCSHADGQAAPSSRSFHSFPPGGLLGLARQLLSVFPIVIYLSGPDKRKHLHPESSSSGRLRCLDVFHFPALPPSPPPNLVQWIDASPQSSQLGPCLIFTPR